MTDYKKYLALLVLIFSLKLLLLGMYPFSHPSESRYASISMRMEISDNYLMPFVDPTTPFFAKPPLSMWASAISFKIFGFNEFAGRLPHLLALMLTCFLLYRAMSKIYSKETGIMAVIALSSCALFHILHSVMTDAFLLLGMTMTSLSFLLQIESKKPKTIDGYLFFIGWVISALAKGPVGIIMPCFPIFIYLLISARWKELLKFPIFSGTIIFAALTLPWFLLAEAKYPGFLEYFLIGENFDRFTKPGWDGDRYGNPHKVPFAMIWFFLLVSVIPLILLFFAKPKQIIADFAAKIKSRDQVFLFFFISFLAPMLVLTFMRNMIVTYAAYALVPLVGLLAIIIEERKMHKFISFLLYFTITIQCVIIAIFLVNPQELKERINYQDYLISHIPQQALFDKDLQLYRIGHSGNLYSLYWYSKNKVVFVDKENFAEHIANSTKTKYIIADEPRIEELPEKYKKQISKIICAKKQQICLYKSINSNNE